LTEVATSEYIVTMRTRRGVVLFLAAGAAAGCAPDVTPGAPDAMVRPDAAPKLPVGDHHPYVIDSLEIPTTNAEAQQIGLDVDGDGEVDNQLGAIVALLSSNGADINATVTEQIDRGELIHLADLQAQALDNAESSALYVWTGANPVPDPCLGLTDTVCRQHLLGSGSFDVTSTAPADAMIFGDVRTWHYSGSRGTVTLEIPLFISDTALTMQLIDARAEVEVSESALLEGRLAGAVTATYLEEEVLPQLVTVLGALVAEDCTGTAPDCCIAGTDGEAVLGYFDTDDSCTVSLAELQDSVLLDSVLAPDVDLLDEEGLSGRDGVLDSVSLGVGFTAVRASYEIPAGLP
jgi:hypothetical protein